VAQTLALVALSARMLAESARRGGFDCIALDLFGDRDTRRNARTWLRIGDPDALRLDTAAASAALRSLRGCAGWIAGGGTDGALGELEASARPLPLIGNGPETVRALRTPRSFFAALAALGIAHPETAFERPADPLGWLCKDLHGSGGLHIRDAAAFAPEQDGPGRYFQRLCAGTPMSALIVATGSDARIVGFNELIVERDGGLPFVYRGVIGPVVLPPGTRRALTEAMHAIVRHFDIVGLNSIDFLLDGDVARILEVNPRPSASMALYDDRWPGGLIAAHVDASLRRAIAPGYADASCADEVRGCFVVYADRAVRCRGDTGERMLASGWAHDVPNDDAPIGAGAPVCTVSATGRASRDVRATLSLRAACILRELAAEHCAQ
jgi:predicted ATP-grasp superfamily ATP-dependent carboligase